MWNRCISAAPRGSWSGFTPQGPSSSTCGQTHCPQRHLFSPSASSPLKSPAGPTSTWTGWANCGCSSVRKIRPRESALFQHPGRGALHRGSASKGHQPKNHSLPVRAGQPQTRSRSTVIIWYEVLLIFKDLLDKHSFLSCDVFPETEMYVLCQI